VQVIHQFKLEDTENLKDLWSTGVDIISSTDYPFAIKDAYEKCLKETEKSLLVSAPYSSKSFVDLIRTNIKGIESIKWLTRLPDKKSYYWVLETTESLKWTFGSKVVIRFRPRLHLKFVVSDDRIVLSGSVNPTYLGTYANDEILYPFANPRVVKRHIEIFYKLWNCPRNTSWEDFQTYHGYNGCNDHRLVYKKIAEKVEQYFNSNGNQKVRMTKLDRQIAEQGFNLNDVTKTVDKLRKRGHLYEPKTGWLQLTYYQTDIHDFQ